MGQIHNQLLNREQLSAIEVKEAKSAIFFLAALLFNMVLVATVITVGACKQCETFEIM